MNKTRKQLTRRQEIFCLKYYELDNASEAARLAGYSPKTAGTNVPQLLKKPLVQERLTELRELEAEVIRKIENDVVMGVLERKQRLTEIARASIPDFVTEAGIKVGRDSIHVGAVQEITTKTKVYKRTGEPVIITNLKLHPPIPAIQELNKMDKLYSDGYQDNRVIKQFNIYVIDNEARDLIGQVGERTKLLNGNADNQSIQGDSEGMGGWEEGDTT